MMMCSGYELASTTKLSSWENQTVPCVPWLFQSNYCEHDITGVSWCGSNAQQIIERKGPLKGPTMVQVCIVNNEK